MTITYWCNILFQHLAVFLLFSRLSFIFSWVLLFAVIGAYSFVYWNDFHDGSRICFFLFFFIDHLISYLGIWSYLFEISADYQIFLFFFLSSLHSCQYCFL